MLNGNEDGRMTHEAKALKAIEGLLFFAVQKGLIDNEDKPFARNLLLDVMHMDAPGDMSPEENIPETATVYVEVLLDAAASMGLIEDTSTERDLFSTRIMGCVTPAPTEVRRKFQGLIDEKGPEAATQWFYQMCRDSDYIRVDHIKKNIRYFAKTDCGELEITINLSKPEKDPKEIAKLKSLPQSGYPKCMLCIENPGYAGRLNYPARQNHRVVPILLGNDKWYIQYSPYLYYPEHCIVFNSRHVPMVISQQSFERLFDFVDQFPNYFIGSNADLPIVGGSILNHDHFQGGHYTFPMDYAKEAISLSSLVSGVRAAVLDWPMSAIALYGDDRKALIQQAVSILNLWRDYSDPACDILAHTTEPHNTITPILRKTTSGYKLMLVLRNNRTTQEHPLGIFHPHAPLHHIKKENIGLIEVMGLFILPGRLKVELKELEAYLTGLKPFSEPDIQQDSYKHYAWLLEIAKMSGTNLSCADARRVLEKAVADVCSQVLADAGVYKQNEQGRKGMLAFLKTAGFSALKNA